MVEFYISMIINSYITNSFSDFLLIMRFMWKWIQRAQPAFRLLARTSQASLLSEYSEKLSR